MQLFHVAWNLLKCLGRLGRAALMALVGYVVVYLVALPLYPSWLWDGDNWFYAVEPEWLSEHGRAESAVAYAAELAPLYALPFAVFLLVYHFLGGAHKPVRFDGETRCRNCGYILRGIPEPRCAKCGYNLTGNVSGICPECGSAVMARTGKEAV